mgnify:CR=1 FL=1
MARKEKKYHFIYKTIDTRNENFYIGMHSSDNLNDSYLGSGKRIRNIKQKHGKDILKLEILEFLPNRDSLKKRELEIVNSDLLKEEKCMNLRIGGVGGFSHETQLRNSPKGIKRFLELMENPKWKEKQLKKISNGVKNYLTTNNKNGMWDGKSHTEETKKIISSKLSKLQKGDKNSQFGTCWITNGIENKKIKKEQDIPLGWKKGRILIKKSC